MRRWQQENLNLQVKLLNRIIKPQSPIGYREALKFMGDLHKSRVEGEISDTFILLEHQPVYTLGSRGGEDNLLESHGIEVVPTDRGGDITYHGPGQIIIYPVINIKELGIGIKEYIYRLEEIIIRLLDKYGLNSGRNPLNRGVWVDNKKIASVGVRVRRGVTLHGIAVNIISDLTPFTWINPCGLTGISISSLKEEIGREIDMNECYNYIIDLIDELFPGVNSD